MDIRRKAEIFCILRISVPTWIGSASLIKGSILFIPSSKFSITYFNEYKSEKKEGEPQSKKERASNKKAEEGRRRLRGKEETGREINQVINKSFFILFIFSVFGSFFFLLHTSCASWYDNFATEWIIVFPTHSLIITPNQKLRKKRINWKKKAKTPKGLYNAELVFPWLNSCFLMFNSF